MSVKLTFDRTKKERLFKKLRQLAPEADTALEEAARQSAAEMVQMARSLVPVRTGALRDSIVATPPGGEPPPYGQGSYGAVPAGAWMVTAGDSKVRYPHLVEFGTKAHINAGTAPGTQHPGTQAQPFFFPAYRTIKKRHQNKASRALGRAIKKVAGS